MAEYVEFHYMPLEGKITGKQVLKQTEDAINDLGQHVYEIDIDDEKIQEAIDTSNQAISTAEAALSAVTTNRAMWFNTVAEMKETDIDIGITAATRGEGVFNDGDGAFYAVRSIKGGDVDGENTVFLDNGNVAERIRQFNLIAKGNKYIANVAELRIIDAEIGNVYATKGYYTENDGGNGVYLIRADNGDTDDGGSTIILNNGNVAELITDGSIDIAQFGAVGDGATDDTSKIQSCLDYCGANSLLCTAKLGKTYYIGGSIVTTTQMDFSQAEFVTNAVADTVVLQIGDTATQQSGAYYHTYKLPSVTNLGHHSADGWSGYDTSIGILCVNLFTSSIYLQRISGFGTGLSVLGINGHGNSYNIYNGGVIRANKVNVLLDGESSGWCTANTFNIPRIRLDAGEKDTGSVPFVGTRNIKMLTAGDNVFMHPCVEGSLEATEYSIELASSSYNLFIAPRLETTGGVNKMKILLRSTGTGTATKGNYIVGGYATSDFDVTSDTDEGGSTSNNGIVCTAAGWRVDQTQPIFLRNAQGGGQPHIVGFSPTGVGNILTIPQNETKWCYQLTALGLRGKNYPKAYTQVYTKFSEGRVYFGRGNAEPANYIGAITTDAMSDTGIFMNCDLYPETTQVSSLGAATNEWKDIYLLHAPTVSSDRNAKQQIRELTEAEKVVAGKCKKLVRAYKLNAEVADKGERAKTHIGAIAQDVVEAFDTEGLNALDYGIVEQDENGKYSIRYAELLAFIIGAL